MLVLREAASEEKKKKESKVKFNAMLNKKKAENTRKKAHKYFESFADLDFCFHYGIFEMLRKK